jgi:hypothetical protein
MAAFYFKPKRLVEVELYFTLVTKLVVIDLHYQQCLFGRAQPITDLHETFLRKTGLSENIRNYFMDAVDRTVTANNENHLLFCHFSLNADGCMIKCRNREFGVSIERIKGYLQDCAEGFVDRETPSFPAPGLVR